jgi:3-deoxy-7-phosphoheptulonate synthase/chorismate mutase
LSSDPDRVIRDLRGQISAADRAVLEAVNRRLELVAELKRYKELHGIAFVDPERERAMLEELARANGGPLSDEGVRELLTMLLDLTKREV